MAAKRRYSLNDEELTALESYLAASLTPMSPRPAFVNALNSRLASPSEPGVWLERAFNYCRITPVADRAGYLKFLSLITIWFMEYS
jgi:hypothetical protein